MEELLWFNILREGRILAIPFFPKGGLKEGRIIGVPLPWGIGTGLLIKRGWGGKVNWELKFGNFRVGGG